MRTDRSYRELSKLSTFMERFEYLELKSQVGTITFGFDRWLNQQFYNSRQWRDIRQKVILRDMGCDLGILGYEIYDHVLIHHINPVTPEDLENGEEWLIDPEFLITTSHKTHNAIHYSDKSQLPRPIVKRKPGDTRLW